MQAKHGRGAGAALRMLDLFASVGVQFFDITHTNIDEQKRGFRRKRSLEETRTSMPYLVDSASRRQNNVIVRPYRPPAALLVQLDDLNAASIERLRPAAFLILNTSPGNFQAWVAVTNDTGATDADFARRRHGQFQAQVRAGFSARTHRGRAAGADGDARGAGGHGPGRAAGAGDAAPAAGNSKGRGREALAEL